MTCNVGGIERTLRISLGVILIAIGYLVGLPVWGAVVLYVLGAAALITGVIQYCPVSHLLGTNTCSPGTSEKG